LKQQNPYEKVKTEALQSIYKNDQKYCKNGHPLDGNGRCFGKGCKYA